MEGRPLGDIQGEGRPLGDIQGEGRPLGDVLEQSKHGRRSFRLIPRPINSAVVRETINMFH